MQEYNLHDLHSQSEALRVQLAEEGYALLRGVIEQTAVRQVGRDLVAVLREEGLPVGDESDPYSFDWEDMPTDVNNILSRTRPQLFGVESLHLLFHSAPLMALATALVQGEFIPHPHKQVRVQPPVRQGDTPQITGAHQDYLYNQGSTEMVTVWVPLGEVHRDMGGLEVLPRSHLGGLIQPRQGLVEGSITYSVENEPSTEEWFCPNYELGDCIAFHSLTLHRASANRSGRVRVSADCRYQAISEPFARELLQPLPGVVEAYANVEVVRSEVLLAAF